MIRMEHLNHHANLYAGRGIEWMVESAFMAACLTHGDKNGLLYKNMHRFDFSRSVEPGDIVRYESTVVRAGRTSLTVHVDLKNEQTGPHRRLHRRDVRDAGEPIYRHLL